MKESRYQPDPTRAKLMIYWKWSLANLKFIGIGLIIADCFAYPYVGFAPMIVGAILILYEFLVALPKLLIEKFSVKKEKERSQKVHQKLELSEVVIYDDGRFEGRVYIPKSMEIPDKIAIQDEMIQDASAVKVAKSFDPDAES